MRLVGNHEVERRRALRERFEYVVLAQLAVAGDAGEPRAVPTVLVQIEKAQEVVPVDDRQLAIEATLHLQLPLSSQPTRTDDEHSSRGHASVKLGPNQPCLDCLA